MDANEKIYQIPLDHIDEPPHAIRSRISDDSLRELADSIRTHGLLQPIILRPREGRYEIIAGHRRYLACRLLGHLVIPAIIRDVDDTTSELIKLSENFYREDVNVVDEARFLAGLIDRYQLSIKELADMIHRSESYVRDRIDMINWDPLILDYLYNDEITFSAAKYIAAIEDEGIRRNWLDIAVRCGITTTQAKAWYEQWTKGALPSQPSPTAEAEIEAGGLGVVIEKDCAICGEKGRLQDMKLVYVHPDCEEYIRYHRKFGDLPVVRQE